MPTLHRTLVGIPECRSTTQKNPIRRRDQRDKDSDDLQGYEHIGSGRKSRHEANKNKDGREEDLDTGKADRCRGEAEILWFVFKREEERDYYISLVFFKKRYSDIYT
ncbi:hypothetical protein Bca4012_061109 [Brassica carinata]